MNKDNTIQIVDLQMNLAERQSRRRTPLMLFGASTKVHYQPPGVVGIVATWNFPVFLGLSPIIGAFAAGRAGRT